MMKKRCALLVVIVFTLFPFYLFSQDEFGGNISGQNWQILRSPAVRVIYPLGMEFQAQHVANIINYIDQNKRGSVGFRRHRLDLVLQNKTTIPNGYVGLAPFRSEFFCTPPSSNLLLGNLDWLDQLSVHEYRHALQFTNANVGFSRAGYYIGGEIPLAVLTNLSIPNWFFEGDAVITETIMTSGGRGRFPFFTLEQRALAFAGKDFSYAKHRNGSYVSLIPDHYRLGYMMLSKARQIGGNDVTNRLLKQSASYKGIIYPFSKALKRNVGYSSKQLYNLSWKESKAQWENELDTLNLIPTEPVTLKPRRTITNYRYPRNLSDGSIIVRKNSYKQTDALYLIKDGKDTRLTGMGISIADDFLSFNADLAAWTEYSKNPRRSAQDYSNIVIFNTKTKKRVHLTQKARYFSPVASPNGETIAAIYITPTQQNMIHILDSKSGVVIGEVDSPYNYFLSRLAWSTDGKSLITIAKSKGKLAIIKIDIENGNVVELTPWTSHTIEAPVVYDSYVYFNASFSGIDNIFRTDLDGSKSIYQITSVPIGAFDPDVTPDGHFLIFTEFTDMGYVISKQDISEIKLNPFEIVDPSAMNRYSIENNDSDGEDILANSFDQAYPSEPYNGLFKGLKLHSWFLIPSTTTPMIRAAFHNILNDVDMQLEGSMNSNEDNSRTISASVLIGRYYPLLSFKVEDAERKADYYSSTDTMAEMKFNESSVQGIVGIPLSWVRGNTVTQFNPSVDLVYRNVYNAKAEGNRLIDKNFVSYDLNLFFSLTKRAAYQNFGPRLGVDVDIKYTRALNNFSNEKIFLNGQLYLPGVMYNHNIRLRGGYQKELLKNYYQFADVFEYPRGYNAPINDEFRLFSCNYGFPLLYPEFGVAGITYFKRVRTNIFYDYGIGSKLNVNTTYSSTGIEMIFDNTFFNLVPLSLGIRESFILKDNPENAGKKYDLSFFVALTL